MGAGTFEVASCEIHPTEHLRRVSFQALIAPFSHTDSGDVDRTKSPILLKHKFVLKAYFSVTGETVEGRPIPNANGVGQLRMLIVNLPQPLPSVRATSTASGVGTDPFLLAVYMRRRMGHATRV